MSLYLGIDLGTTLFKAALFSGDGNLVGLGRARLEKDEHAGRCELSVDSFWALLRLAIDQALDLAGARGGDVSALGYSSQANSFVLLDNRGECLTPLILWPDQRAVTLEGHGVDLWEREDFLITTGIGLSSIEFCPHKLDWFRKRQSHLWGRIKHVQTISDYLVFGLTGNRVGDQSTASMTGLWDQRREEWWPAGLAAVGIPADTMSTPLRPGAVAGGLTADGATRIGLLPGTLLVLGGLDHYVAGLGAGLGCLADVSESTGTVLACIAQSAQYRPRPSCCVGPTRAPGQYYYLVFNESGTAKLDWYQANHAPEQSIPELIRRAEDAPPGCLGLRVRPTLQGGSLDGAFDNLNEAHQPGHHVRAILEANALALSELLQDLTETGAPAQILATGGGARSGVWLQLKADMLGVEVLQTDCEEPACQGAAMLAAVASGGIASLQDASALFHRVKQRFSPEPRRHALYRELFGHGPHGMGAPQSL